MIGWPPEMANQQRPAQYEKTNHFDFKGNLWKNNALHTEQELKEENISDKWVVTPSYLYHIISCYESF